jgi:hypothetical protein
MTTFPWMQFYEAAVLETNPALVLDRIRAAQQAIGRRVISVAITENERRAIVRTLDALSVLKRERIPSHRALCQYCQDAQNPVTALNSVTFLARTSSGQDTVSLHVSCIAAWREAHRPEAMVPLKRKRKLQPVVYRGSDPWHVS